MARQRLRNGAQTARRPGFRVCPQRVALALLCVIGYTVLLSINIFRVRVTLKPNDIAQGDLFADATVEVEDQAETANRRQRARDSAAKVYISRRVQATSVEKINALLDAVAAVAGAEDLTDDAARLSRLRAQASFAVSDAHLASLLQWTPDELSALRSAASDLLGRVYTEDREIRDDEPATRQAAVDSVTELVADYEVRSRLLLLQLVTHPEILLPNREYDAQATEAERQRLADEVEPAVQVFQRGQKIIGRGDRVTAEHTAVFEALGWVQPRRDYRGLFARACIVLLILVVLGAYVFTELPQVYSDTRKLVLINLVIAGGLLLFRLILALKGPITTISHPAILCGAMTGSVVAVLLDFRLAMMVTAALAMLMGLLVPGAGLWVTIEGWLAGRVGAMSINAVKDRTGVAVAGITMAVAGMLIAVIVQLPQIPDGTVYTPRQLLVDVSFGFGWGLSAFILSMGLIPMLERPFGCVTPFRLLELTNTSTPVLQRLQREARGSFDASLTIGEMAAEACEAIGADPLLARACGYHHDIGKIRHPSWFIENQFGGPNIHDKLTPEMSAKAIKSHVTEGYRMAVDAKLPEPLCDVIRQHHGTTRISFFYYQALERCPEGGQVDEALFRYEGPKPRFKESGIIMLADGIEAAVRAAGQHGPLNERKIHDIVNGIIRQRLDEGQLDECPLTLREVHLAAEAFCDHLHGMYHSRIDYPPQSMRARRNGDG